MFRSQYPHFNLLAIIATALDLSIFTARADVTSQATWTIASGGNGHTYRVVAKTGLISWDAASLQAQAAGGYLATITSAEENAFVFALIDDQTFWNQTQNDHGPWIGLYQPPGSVEPAGGWAWVSQIGATSPELFSYANWETGEPNNQTKTIGATQYNENRAAFFHTGTGMGPTWCDEYDLTGASLNQWTKSFVIEFGPAPFTLLNPVILDGGSVDLSFTNAPGLLFSVVATTNVNAPWAAWTPLGSATESSPGQYQFIDVPPTNLPARFYGARSQ